MAEAALNYDVTAPVRQLAGVIVDAQQAEIATMRSLLDHPRRRATRGRRSSSPC